MIKITKGAIPASLTIPLDPKNEKPHKGKTTHQRRLEVIDKKSFPKEDKKYSDRYKQDDIKESLKQSHHDKCCYCEQKVERRDVEHFRPKSIYYWLAYSWDNLLFACVTCNEDYKKAHFELLPGGVEVVFDPSDLSKIHELTTVYHVSEKPKFLHPVLEEVESFLAYNDEGEISPVDNNDDRVKYTIEKLQLNREYLKDSGRKKLIRELIEKIKDRELVYPENCKEHIVALIRDWMRESQDSDNEFLGFRRFVAQHLLGTILKSVLVK